MKFDWSEINIRREYGEYGIAGTPYGLFLVTLSMHSGSTFVIGNFTKPEHFPLQHFENMVAALETTARGIAASETCDRFMAEAEAYVRSRPEGSRSSYMTEDDADWRDDAVADIRSGLVLALKETDPYRAARSFEARIPYLVADIEIIDLMSPIIATFHGELDVSMGVWVEKAGDRQQTLVSRRSQFVNAAVGKFHESYSSAAHNHI